MFRTEFKPSPLPFRISYESNIISLGSWFADAIGDRMSDLKFNIQPNPFGTIFNPISVFNSITSSDLNEQLFTHYDDTVFHHSYHSDVHANTVDDYQKLINTKRQYFHKSLDSCDVLIVTFGTAFIHRHIDSNTIVSNCHKAPSNLFQKELAKIFIPINITIIKY